MSLVSAPGAGLNSLLLCCGITLCGMISGMSHTNSLPSHEMGCSTHNRGPFPQIAFSNQVDYLQFARHPLRMANAVQLSDLSPSARRDRSAAATPGIVRLLLPPRQSRGISLAY